MENSNSLDNPSAWVAIFDENHNRNYYYSTASGATTWRRPTIRPDLPGPAEIEMTRLALHDQEMAQHNKPGIFCSGCSDEDCSDCSYRKKITAKQRDRNVRVGGDLGEIETRRRYSCAGCDRQSCDSCIQRRANRASNFKRLSSLSRTLNLTKDYAQFAAEHIGRRKYSRRCDGNFDDSITCVLCAKEQCSDVFFPCGHMCVCSQCIRTRQIGGVDQVGADVWRSCSVCCEEIKLILRHEPGGAEQEKYWSWAFEIKPHLPPAFKAKFGYTGQRLNRELLIQQKLGSGLGRHYHEASERRISYLSRWCCLLPWLRSRVRSANSKVIYSGTYMIDEIGGPSKATDITGDEQIGSNKRPIEDAPVIISNGTLNGDKALSGLDNTILCVGEDSGGISPPGFVGGPVDAGVQSFDQG
jgi:hypothetical protein